MTNVAAGWLGRTFSALRHRNYLLLWIGTFISNSGDWMDQVALNWLVVTFNGSAFDLALVNLCRGLPILFFTLLGGAMADRFERRRLMIVTQTSAMLLALLLAVLTLTDIVSIPLVLFVATARGIVISFNLPLRHSMVAELVPPAEIPNAVALNSLTANLTKIVGPAAAGLIIGAYGTGVCFLVNALSTVAAIWTLYAMVFPPRPARPQPESLARSIAGGLHYVRHNRTILLLVLIALVPTFFGQPYMTLLALFAHNVYRIGPEGLGLLTACAAAGSVTGALVIAAVPRWATSGRVMLLVLVAFGVMLVAFALNAYLFLAPVLLFGVGAMHIAYSATNNTILQLRVEDHMRGRVISVLLLNRGLVQLGAAFAAGLAGLIGTQFAVASTGLVIVAFGFVAFGRARDLQEIR